jgi:hypothetical protein
MSTQEMSRNQIVAALVGSCLMVLAALVATDGDRAAAAAQPIAAPKAAAAGCGV